MTAVKIVIDARMLHWTGIGRYIQALLNELPKLDGVNDYTVLMRREDWQRWEPAAHNFKKVESNIQPYSLGEQWALLWQLKALRPDLVHFTAPNAPVLYQAPRVVSIHDLTLLDFDTSRGHGLMRQLRRLKRPPFRFVLRNDVRGARMILTPTDYVGAQLQKRYGVVPERLRTTWLAADAHSAEPASLQRFGALGDYLFYVGTMYPYKNLASTLHAMRLLKDSPLTLVVAGRRDFFSGELEALAQRLGVSERVKLIDYVSEGELVALYQGARAYVNPSLSEGFGLQGLEAMAQGTPVVAARASCLPEVYGEAAEYFDPHDPADQARAIAAVVENHALSQRLIQAGFRRCQQFSWSKMAQQTLQAYEAALTLKR